ncbi:MAG TPA: DPP IV N-terminal domain-containing protein, partial [Phenylobacterium sp.]|nr:DPP IV N-terminal domain-containing protein [Phenylobacterium sp.]
MNGAVKGPLDGQARYQAMLAGQGLVRGGRIEPVWLGSDLAFIDRAGETAEVVVMDRATGAVRWRRPVGEMTGEAQVSEPIGLHAAPDGGLLLQAAGKLFAASPGEGACRLLTDAEAAALAARQPKPTFGGYPTVFPAETEVLSPDGTQFATLRDHDLWIRSLGGDETRRLTFDGLPDLRWSTGQAAWSPDGRRLALMRTDEREVHRVPLVDWMADTATVSWATYPRADGAIPVSRVFLIDVESGQATEVGGGDAGHYA